MLAFIIKIRGEPFTHPESEEDMNRPKDKKC